MPLSIVILAAGQGKRMKSDLPKVLQPLAGRPLLGHVLATAAELRPDAIHVVYGHGGEQVLAAFAGQPVRWALATRSCRPCLPFPTSTPCSCSTATCR